MIPPVDPSCYYPEHVCAVNAPSLRGGVGWGSGRSVVFLWTLPTRGDPLFNVFLEVPRYLVDGCPSARACVVIIINPMALTHVFFLVLFLFRPRAL